MSDISPSPSTPETPQAVVNEAIRDAAEEATALAQSVAKVNLEFPEIGFIDVREELEKVRRIAAEMPEDARRTYPEAVRAKLLAHHAAPQTAPAVSDEELALAIYIRRTTDTTLSVDDVEAKTTGKAPKKEKATKLTKAEKSSQAIDDLLSGI